MGQQDLRLLTTPNITVTQGTARSPPFQVALKLLNTKPERHEVGFHRCTRNGCGVIRLGRDSARSTVRFLHRRLEGCSPGRSGLICIGIRNSQVQDIRANLLRLWILTMSMLQSGNFRLVPLLQIRQLLEEVLRPCLLSLRLLHGRCCLLGRALQLGVQLIAPLQRQEEKT